MPDALGVPAVARPDYVAALHAIAAAHGVALIVPTVSEELPIVAAYADGPVPILAGSVAATAMAGDKWWTARILEAAGVATPRFTAVGSEVDVEALGRSLGWPFVTKPRMGRGGRGVVVHRQVGGIPDQTFLRVPSIAQEFAPGVEYVVNVYRPWSSRETTTVVLRKLSRAHGEVGNATAVERVDELDVASLAARAVAALDLRGPADLDVRRRVDGQPVVLEVNARFGAHSAFAPEILREALADLGIAEMATA
ncbi:ATP-grasp domain-containing protein [Cryptosporangium japonicum]